MTSIATIPTFSLFGETAPFPDFLHSEAFSARAPVHGWTIPAHRHAQMAQVFLVEDGRIDARVDDRTYVLENGYFLYVPVHSVHEFNFLPDTEGQVISLTQSVLSSLGPRSEALQATLAAPCCDAVSEHLRQITGLLTRTLARPGPFRSQVALGLAHSVLGNIAETALAHGTAQHEHRNRKLAQLDALLGERMADGWSAADYAAALSVSTGHLSRLCRVASGMGAAAYIEHRVMEEACRMLAFTQLPISQIGYRLGFADPSHFTKRFRAIRQQTPTDYRAQFIT